MTHPTESQIEQAVEAMAQAIWEREFDPKSSLTTWEGMSDFYREKQLAASRADLLVALPYITAPAPEASGLQPIETAPKDNKAEIDLWADNIRYPNCHYHCGQWLFWDYRSVDEEPTWSEVKNPTHWMPLPAPPQGAVAPPPGPDERRRILDLPTGSVVHMTEQNAYLVCAMTQEAWLREFAFDGGKLCWDIRIRSDRREEPEQASGPPCISGPVFTEEADFWWRTCGEYVAKNTAALALIRKMQEAHRRLLSLTRGGKGKESAHLIEAQALSSAALDEATAFLKEQEGK